MLGLIANNFVRVYHPSRPRRPRQLRRRHRRAAGSQSNLRIDAAILAIQHSFIVDHYDCGAPLGTLTVNGAIGQKFRGAVGTFGGSTLAPATSRTTTTTTGCATSRRRTSSTRSSRPGTSSARRSTTPEAPRRAGLRRGRRRTIPAWQRSPSPSSCSAPSSAASSPSSPTGSRAASRSSAGARAARAAEPRSRARDNVPIVSWLWLRGRCRDCGEPISARYPLTEAGLGALWAATYLILGSDDGGRLALGLVLCAVLVVITLTDLELRLIPNAIVLSGAVVGDRDRRRHATRTRCPRTWPRRRSPAASCS